MGVITDNLDLWGEAVAGTLILFFGGGLIALVLGLIVGPADAPASRRRYPDLVRPVSSPADNACRRP